MVCANRRNQITGQEFRIRDSRVNRRERLRLANGRPRVIYIDHDLISPEVQVLIRNGEAPMPIEFAPLDNEEIEYMRERPGTITQTTTTI